MIAENNSVRNHSLRNNSTSFVWSQQHSSQSVSPGKFKIILRKVDNNGVFMQLSNLLSRNKEKSRFVPMKFKTTHSMGNINTSQMLSQLSRQNSQQKESNNSLILPSQPEVQKKNLLILPQIVSIKNIRIKKPTKIQIPSTPRTPLKRSIWSKVTIKNNHCRGKAYHETVLYMGKIFFLGGTDNKWTTYANDNSSVDVLVPLEEENAYEWEKITVLNPCDAPSTHQGHTCSIYNQYMYWYGGQISVNKNSNELKQLNLESMEWLDTTPLGARPLPIEGHSAVVVDDKILYFGGFTTDGDPRYINSIQEYDITTKTWHVRPQSNGPTGRVDHAAIALQGMMYVHGGTNNGGCLDDMWQYSLSTGAWRPIPTRGGPTCRASHGMLSNKNKVYVFGGSAGYLKEKNDLWSLDTESGAWNRCDEINSEDSPTTRLPIIKYTSLHSPILKQNSIQPKISAVEFQRRQVAAKEKQKLLDNFRPSSSERVLVQTPTTMKLRFFIDHIQKSGMGQTQVQQQQGSQSYLGEATPAVRGSQSQLGEATPAVRGSQSQLGEATPSPSVKRPIMFTTPMISKPQPRDSFSLVDTGECWMIFGGDCSNQSLNDAWIVNKNLLR